MTEVLHIRLSKDTVVLLKRASINPRDSADLTIRKFLEMALGNFDEPVFTNRMEWDSPPHRYGSALKTANYGAEGATTIRVRERTKASLDQLRELREIREQGEPEIVISYDQVIVNLINYMTG